LQLNFYAPAVGILDGRKITCTISAFASMLAAVLTVCTGTGAEEYSRAHALHAIIVSVGELTVVGNQKEYTCRTLIVEATKQTYAATFNKANLFMGTTTHRGQSPRQIIILIANTSDIMSVYGECVLLSDAYLKSKSNK
jgi:hypothetical protein